MLTENDLYEWKCPEELRLQALANAAIRINNGEYARDLRLNRDERAKKIAIGYIGEYGFKAWCSQMNVPINYLGAEVGTGPDNGDFKTAAGLVIDVKTQENKYRPSVNWRCEVTGEQMNRPVDIYVFCKLRTMEQGCTLYMAGWETKERFKANAIFRNKGDLLLNKPVHYPKWDITIGDLNSMVSLKGTL